jgi:hypothetical protein
MDELMERPAGAASGERLEVLRRWILAVLAFGLLGTITELTFLSHFEQPLQYVPMVLIVLSLITILWQWRAPSAGSLRAFQILMVLFVVAGAAGIIAHAYGSAEFQFDLNPDIRRWELVEKVLRAKAPPVLAPGMMAMMGLFGLGYVYTAPQHRSHA